MISYLSKSKDDDFKHFQTVVLTSILTDIMFVQITKRHKMQIITTLKSMAIFHSFQTRIMLRYQLVVFSGLKLCTM